MWINEIKNPKPCVIRAIKRTSKGLILVTSDYDAFVFANSQLARHLLEAMEYWEKDCNGLGFELIVTPDKSKKLGFSVEMGNERTYFTAENLWTIDPDELPQDNPFITATVKSNRKLTPNPLLKERKKKEAKQMKAEFDESAHQPPPDAA